MLRRAFLKLTGQSAAAAPVAASALFKEGETAEDVYWKMQAQTNPRCDHCGALMSSPKGCEYCGTPVLKTYVDGGCTAGYITYQKETVVKKR